MGLLAKYKALVKRNPGVVQNLDWLLYLVNFNPSRLSSSGEANYELYHAAIGLLSLFHQGVLEEDELPAKRPSSSVWLDAVEQVLMRCGGLRKHTGRVMAVRKAPPMKPL